MAFINQSAAQIRQLYEDRKAESVALEALIPPMTNEDLKTIAKLLADQNRWLRALVRITIQADQGV